MEPYLQKINELILNSGSRVLGSLLILVLGLWVSKRLANLLKEILGKSQLDPTFTTFFGNMLQVVLTGVVALAAVSNLGVPMTSVLALLGTAGLAIALALKDSLNHVAAGISLLILRPFKVTEYVEVGGVGGTVTEINLFHTLLHTPDNRAIAVPNAKILADIIINFSRNPQRRIDLVVGISYDSDLKRAKAVLWELIQADARILKDPEPVVAVADLGPNSVDLAVRPWVHTPDYWNVRFELLEAIKARFEQEGIVIPFPQRTVHVYDHRRSV